MSDFLKLLAASLVAAFVAAACVELTHAVRGDGGCHCVATPHPSPANYPATPPPLRRLEWRRQANADYWLFDGDRRLGCYRPSSREYFAWDAYRGVWTQPTAPPSDVALPIGAVIGDVK